MSEEKNEKIGVDWHEHQSFSRQCFEENVSGIYISNIDGYLITCNDAFAKIFGISSGFEATGTSLSSFFPDSQWTKYPSDRVHPGRCPGEF